MGARHAVLIGVPKNKKDAKLDLPIVHNDISNLHSSLEACGYVVSSQGIEDPSEASANLIEDAIDEACKAAQPGSTLLFYFSGHGIHYNGKDLLVPWDGHFNDPTRIERSLVSTDISRFVDRSAASLIVFFVDACREGMKWEFKSSSSQGWGLPQYGRAESRRFVLVYSCRPGELSQYTGGQNGYSLFSKALSKVLAPTHPAESIDEVVRATQQELNRLIQETGKAEQHIRISGEQELTSEYLAHKISDGRPMEGSTVGMRADWTEISRGSRLWRFANTYEHPSAAVILDSVSRLVASCEKEWGRSKQLLPDDPWRDHAYPIRVIACLEMLLNSLPHLELSPIEASLLVSAPFVREAVYSCAVSEIAGASPLSVAQHENRRSSMVRRRLEMTHSSHPQMIRKISRSSDTRTRQSIALWLVHRCIARDPNTWQIRPEGYISAELSLSLELAQNELNGTSPSRHQLMEFAQCVGSDPSRIERKDRSYVLRERVVIGTGPQEQQLREQLVGYLLCVAGWMAIDIRSMSDILPDHLGTTDPVSIEGLHEVLSRANWKAIGRSRSLEITCQHPAIDFAIRDLVIRSNETMAEVHRRAAETDSNLKLLMELPNRLGAELIKPEIIDDKAAYEIPHLNFHLSQDEVRELLMGEQLYDQPELAIRELYQNALDACRYRQARLQYLDRTGRLDGANRWEGSIGFVQGKDPVKGRYIECRDNGIGMGHRELESCFAKAGKRFCDLPEFIEEQNEWIRCDPPIRMYPNSQFGVGVFSYFMLADELEIETCRLDRKGRPGNRLLITIPGSGSLFRVQELGRGEDAGTRIRLYLRENEALKALSCVRTLTNILWIAEFHTLAKHSWRKAEWIPSVLRYPWKRKQAFPKAKDSPIWWTTEYGKILADGIVISANELHNENISSLLSTGIVVNLVGERKPNLTVDRRKARSLDIEWIQLSAANSVDCLFEWDGLSYMWLWSFLSVFPELEDRFNRELRRRNRVLPVKGRVGGELQKISYDFGSYLSGIEERLLGEGHGRELDILPYGDLTLDPKEVGLSRVWTRQVDINRSDACLWRLVWEAWNWEFRKRSFGSPFERLPRFPRLLTSPFADEDGGLADPEEDAISTISYSQRQTEEYHELVGRLALKKWFRKLKIDGITRLKVWQDAGLLLPDWLIDILGDLRVKGLSDHYFLKVIPKSNVALKLMKKRVLSLVLQTKHSERSPLRIALNITGLILIGYLLLLFLFKLTKLVLNI